MAEARKRGTRDASVMDYVESGENYSTMDNYGIMVGQVHTQDSHLRSLAKGLTWRFVASGTTIVIAKIVTGDVGVALKVGFFEFFAKIGIYYLHERIWAKIKL